MTEQDAAVLITLIPGVQDGVWRKIYQQTGSFSSYFSDAESGLPQELTFPKTYFHNNQHALYVELARRKEKLAEQHIHLFSLADDSYPLLLGEIHRPPVVLYVKGNVEALSMPQIGIVGSRRPSRGGLGVAEELARGLAVSGFTVTSGLASGIDTAAHRGAVSGGSTIAVLGCGVDVVYPARNRSLMSRILEADGAIVSEFPPGSQPLRHHFPQRNRIISGLSMGIVVVEAAIKSGSLITARLAMEQGREVFAIPGSIHNPMVKGCHQLIREGAVLTENLQDIVNNLGGLLELKYQESSLVGSAETTDVSETLSTRENAVLKAMSFDPIDMDTLIQAAAMSVAELTVVLVKLEMSGYIENQGAFYLRIK